jgi:hypothetical protein
MILEIESTGEPFRLTIASLDDGESVILPTNPAQTEHEFSPQWEVQNLAGLSTEPALVDYKGRGPEAENFTIILSAGNTGTVFADGSVIPDESAELAIERTLQTLRRWTKELAPGKNRPRVFDVVKGDLHFTGVIARLSIRRNQTSARGYSKAAEVSISFQERAL